MIRLLRSGVLSAIVALLLAAAPIATGHAQGGGGQGAGGAGATTDTRATQDAPRREDGFDPGWFGLLGLAGLFGLRRPREETTTTRVDAPPVAARRP